jgi:hypothetical protein
MALFVMYDLGRFRTLLTGLNVPANVIDQIVAAGNATESDTVALIDLNGDIAPGSDKIQVTRNADSHKVIYTPSGGSAKNININAKVPPRNPETFKALLQTLGYERK